MLNTSVYPVVRLQTKYQKTGGSEPWQQVFLLVIKILAVAT
jgi:hypothetical protein